MGYSTYQLEQLAKMTYRDLIDKNTEKKMGTNQKGRAIRRLQNEARRGSHEVVVFTPGWEK